MKKLILGISLGIVISVLTVNVAFALPQNRGIDQAGQVSPVIENGELIVPPPFAQPPESQLQKVVFIRYAPGKEPKARACDYDGVCDSNEGKWCADCKNGGEEPAPSACYGFLSGAKPRWKWTEDYYSSAVNLAKASATSTNIWESVTSGEIFGQSLLGSYPWGVYDYTNAISFGNYSDPDVIAITAIWFQGKTIYEYDIMFDTDYFPNGQEASYDLESVNLHEFGHAAGLDDLYDSVCANEVMYGYYQGEKMTLNNGDITRIQTLYGK